MCLMVHPRYLELPAYHQTIFASDVAKKGDHVVAFFIRGFVCESDQAILRRREKATPAKPKPIRASEAGSGTVPGSGMRAPKPSR